LEVLLDCPNPVAEWPNVDHGNGKSGAEQVAAWAAGSRVVKIFNTTGYENMADPKYGGQGLTMLYAAMTLTRRK
jgi:predicted dinucleotide-binding enzyme